MNACVHALFKGAQDTVDGDHSICNPLSWLRLQIGTFVWRNQALLRTQ